MKYFGIIPSRFESSRFPGKPLIDLKGKSMIQRVYERASQSDFLEEVIVATDDTRIFEHVLSFGGKVVMTDKNHPSGTDRCEEASQKAAPEDVIINIQGDEPLIDPQQISQLCQLFEREDVHIGSLCKPFEKIEDLDNPNRIKVVMNHRQEALYFSRSRIPFEHQPSLHSYFRHIGIYAYRKKTLSEITKLEVTELERKESLEQLRWLYHGYTIQMGITHISTPNIDTPEDVKSVLNLL